MRAGIGPRPRDPRRPRQNGINESLTQKTLAHYELCSITIQNLLFLMTFAPGWIVSSNRSTVWPQAEFWWSKLPELEKKMNPNAVLPAAKLCVNSLSLSTRNRNP